MLDNKSNQIKQVLEYTQDPEIVRAAISFLESHHRHRALMQVICHYSVKYSVLNNCIKDRNWNRASLILTELFEIILK